MSDDAVAVIIPFRDRGTDPLRLQNLYAVLDHWDVVPHRWRVFSISDGRVGDAQFNRSAAYNRGVEQAPEARFYVFAEADVLVPFQQVALAIEMAHAAPGLVVPFDRYRYLGPSASDLVRRRKKLPMDVEPQRVMTLGSSVGAVNVISRETYEAVGGYDEMFEGSWYDDNAMMRAFEQTCGPTRWVEGPVHHLYHKPGWQGDHLTDADRAATARNKERLERYRRSFTPEKIRKLTMEGRT